RGGGGRYAGAEGTVVVAPPLGEGVLLLSHVALLLLPLLLLHLLLFIHVLAAPHHAEEPSHASAEGRALSSVTPDGAAHRSECRSAHGSSEHPSLRPLRLLAVRGRRWWPAHLGIRRVEAALLDCPAVALSLVGLFLLRRLAAGRIDVEPLSPSFLRQRKKHHHAQQQPKPLPPSRHRALLLTSRSPWLDTKGVSPYRLAPAASVFHRSRWRGCWGSSAEHARPARDHGQGRDRRRFSKHRRAHGFLPLSSA